ncbi:MAG: hypothetical protein U0175_34010 [Caldilineaceae bacterium]
MVITACQPIQPAADLANEALPGEQPTPAVATSINNEQVNEESEIREIVTVAGQMIFSPTQPYSSSFASIAMGLPMVWIDYSVLNVNELHGYVHSMANPKNIAYECAQTQAGSRRLPNPASADAMQFSPCNLFFQLIASVLPESPQFSNQPFLFSVDPNPVFSSFISLGQKEIATQFEFLGEEAMTRLADGYQYTTADSTVELWLDSETGLPMMLNNTPNESTGPVPFQSFSFIIRW